MLCSGDQIIQKQQFDIHFIALTILVFLELFGQKLELKKKLEIQMHK